MSQWQELQRDFSGGEISPRVGMRDDLELHSKSMGRMENFMPTLQGTMVRTPGTQYVYTAPDLDIRLFPFLTPANERAMVEMTPAVYDDQGALVTPGALRILTNITGGLGTSGTTLVRTQLSRLTESIIFRRINRNSDWQEGPEFWEPSIGWYTNSKGDEVGMEYEPYLNRWIVIPQLGKRSEPLVTLKQELTIPTNTTAEGLTYLTVTPNILYTNNFDSPDAEYRLEMMIGTTPGAQDIYYADFKDEQGNSQVPGYRYNRPTTVRGLSLTPGQVLYVTILAEAVASPGNADSTPAFSYNYFRVGTEVTVDLGDGTVVGDVPYDKDEIQSVHFVQSPYVDSSGGLGKEIVFTHPRYAPKELIFTGGQYTFRDKPFVNEPEVWALENYPATCASFHGRLILAGGQNTPLLGSPTVSSTETVWGTEVSRWNQFTLEEINPDDSIEFTTIYRSPIQWVYGQKDLLVGAAEMEYVASTDGIFSPGDLGVFMHSTHGSINVQPTGFGESVLFPADGGTKVRSMNYQEQDAGWVAPDLTLYNPEITKSGIRRMVRMRNPHQMAVCVLNNGQLAVLHQDTYAKVLGWSRINLNGNVRDAVVITDDNNVDVLFITIERTIQGEKVLYVEAFSDWIDGITWKYVSSHSVFSAPEPTYEITNMEHLAGEIVDVVGEDGYLGSFPVTDDGRVLLLNPGFVPVYVEYALIGLAMTSRARTMPLITADPSSLKRYTSINVRTLVSCRPLINGERAADRDPISLQDQSEPLDLIADNKVAAMGWTTVASIEIKETVPLRCEVLGIFGKVGGNSL